MYVNFLSTYSDKKSCHTSTTLQTSIARFVSDIAELLVLHVRLIRVLLKINQSINHVGTLVCITAVVVAICCDRLYIETDLRWQNIFLGRTFTVGSVLPLAVQSHAV